MNTDKLKALLNRRLKRWEDEVRDCTANPWDNTYTDAWDRGHAEGMVDAYRDALVALAKHWPQSEPISTS